ncbi:DUF3310 domain-containing protein [Staphylococcus epidermidis]|jgi:hypothetical protein|uniref:DUF3310 domain-containing protein n=1 Tax=Staphylococcus phage vB_SepiS-phiIPLA7 TaxID=2922989 RepID=I6SN75_9CAUD|nr:DUF3310 domain-containing protein [Staphylococcus epidermidis]YP_006561210.1 nucleotide kinase [Staphylococcus phage Ipla7]MDU5817450.1 DUF3310 domain-containing protein [Staphylococcus sp.]DAK13642.1 MAG TPA: nucelotide kinase [Caudoviricetes sp.]AFM73818.1 hypothetical protein IPLA7_0048 [Staphylococcus phage Ipla7]MBM0873575.1 DUF3310 domain-containing protein [Staphylococcus epidermidis]MCG1881546.1 DUF3310 domain-containing protein [Staphylococcus epidermidis]
MSVKDLSRGNTIRMHGLNGVEVTAKVKNVYRLVHSRRGAAKWVADVKAIDGKTWTIDDNYDFYSLPDENEENKKTLYDKINHPSHYTYGEIEVIEFIEQVTKDYKPELAFAIGNAIKYISRANRKNGKEDLDKARWYLNRAFEKWEG